MPNLKTLICNGAKNLKDDHLIKFLRCANNLECIKIERCPKITNSVIEMAIEVTRHRKNNVLLKINISKPKISVDKRVEIPKLLHLA